MGKLDWDVPEIPMMPVERDESVMRRQDEWRENLMDRFGNWVFRIVSNIHPVDAVIVFVTALMAGVVVLNANRREPVPELLCALGRQEIRSGRMEWVCDVWAKPDPPTMEATR
jgi:hypothetical protein